MRACSWITSNFPDNLKSVLSDLSQSGASPEEISNAQDFVSDLILNFLLFILLGKGAEKKIRISYGLLPNQGGGSARVVKKPYCFFEKSIFSESMQNHSRTPKTCFTLGLECICQVYS